MDFSFIVAHRHHFYLLASKNEHKNIGEYNLKKNRYVLLQL